MKVQVQVFFLQPALNA